jgi:hypothetical protein
MLAAEKGPNCERQYRGLHRGDDGSRLHMPDSYSQFLVMTGSDLLAA